jgi:hypothetical protein
MPRYIFVYDERDDSFPERYRVVSPEEDAEALRAAEELTGTVPEVEAGDFLDALLARCPVGSPMRAEIVDAIAWGVVGNAYKEAYYRTQPDG